jgi:peptidoglycan/LPS O-acetylase OafA/YrhL
VTEREPYVWTIAIVLAWLVVVTVVVLAADGADPTVEAGTVVMLLPLVGFGANLVAGVRGRDRHWATRSGVAMGLALGLAYLVLIVARGEHDALYLVPLIAFVAAVVLWLCCGAGWLVGSVIRHGLGLGDARHDDEGFL